MELEGGSILVLLGRVHGACCSLSLSLTWQVSSSKPFALKEMGRTTAAQPLLVPKLQMVKLRHKTVGETEC